MERLKVSEEPDEDAVLKQLKKTQANISIWSLLLSSYPHRQALCKALGEHQVPTDTTSETLVANLITAGTTPALAFSDKDLPLEGN